jgi:serine-type D-Ala-D-Ala carboxypeptidase
MERPGGFAPSLVVLTLLGACISPPRPLFAGDPRIGARSVKVLSDGTNGQDRRFAEAFQEIDRWVAKKAFPGAVLAVGQHGRLIVLKAFGRMDYGEHASKMRRDEEFDLASLTKVIATTSAAAILYDRKQLDLDAPVIQYLPEFAGVEGHDQIRVRHLLTHSSGLNSRQVIWKQATDRAGVLKGVFALKLDWPPGERTQYRDYNMIVMGEIVSRITGEPLDQFVSQNVFKPLGMKHTRYNPPATWIRRTAPTEMDNTLRHQLMRGIVHDENAYLMGGVSGHAGLFSTARDLSAIAQLWLNGGVYKGHRILSDATVHFFMARQLSPAGTTRALGWDTPGDHGFPGKLAAPTAIIHTGFTGTSIYIDPQRDAFLILLTNRVNPTRANELINQARPAIHTAVLSIFDHE